MYTALWVAFFLPAETRHRRGLGVSRSWHVLALVTGLMLSVVLVESLFLGRLTYRARNPVPHEEQCSS